MDETSVILSPDVVRQLANGLEAVRNSIAVLETRTDMLIQQSDMSKSERDHDKSQVVDLITEVAVLNKDVLRISDSIQSLNVLILTGANPLKERIALLENYREVLKIQQLDFEHDIEKTVDEQKNLHRQETAASQDKRFQILINAIGWILSAIAGAIITWYFG